MPPHERRAIIEGCGGCLPGRGVSNDALAEKLDTSDEWIHTRTGIRTRHIADEGENTSHLATRAAKEALEDAGMKADEVDLIVLATATPDHTFPSTATQVQAALGMTRGFAFDVQAVCSGFLYALTTADSFIRAGRAQNALVIGAETFSRILDWEDRTTCVLFGDGAGAVALRASKEGEERGFLASQLHSDGRFKDILYVDGGPSSTQEVGHLRMQGRDVFRKAVVVLSDVVAAVAESQNITPQDIDWFVPHQGNRRIIQAVARKLDVPLERVIITIAEHANTSAASVPLALWTAWRDGRIKKGDLVMLDAIGGGLSWGAALLRW